MFCRRCRVGLAKCNCWCPPPLLRHSMLLQAACDQHGRPLGAVPGPIRASSSPLHRCIDPDISTCSHHPSPHLAMAQSSCPRDASCSRPRSIQHIFEGVGGKTPTRWWAPLFPCICCHHHLTIHVILQKWGAGFLHLKFWDDVFGRAGRWIVLWDCVLHLSTTLDSHVLPTWAGSRYNPECTFGDQEWLYTFDSWKPKVKMFSLFHYKYL